MNKIFLIAIAVFLISLVSAIGSNESLILPTAPTFSIQTAPAGFVINATSNTSIYVIQKHSTSNASTASIYIRTSSGDGALLANATFVGDNATFSPAIRINTSTRDYFVVTSSNGGAYNNTRNATIPPFPIINSQIRTNLSVRLNVAEFNDQTENILAIYTSNLSTIGLNLLHPTNTQNFTTQNLYFTSNVTSSDGVLGITNVSLLINGTVNQTNTSGFNGVYNFSVTMPYGFWNYTFRAYGNDTAIYSSTNGTLNFTVQPIIFNSYTFNTSSAETANESFYANITTNGTTPSLAYLVYNGTAYTAQILNTAGNNYNISSTIDIPLVNTTKNFNWVVTLNGFNSTSITQSQIVVDTIFTACNATWSNDFLNITFRDEVSLSPINASIPDADFVYYLGSGLVNKTLSFSNAGNSINYSFCGSPTSSFLNVLPSVQYKQNSTYPQRTWNPTVQNYNSSVFEQVLYLLSSGDGLYVTFQVVNLAGETITDVSSNVTKTSDGTIVGSGTTDAAGLITFFLNPDVQHTLGFSKTGYTTYTASIFPTQSSYTITLGGDSTTTDNYAQGVSRRTSPSQGFLDEGTIYNFSYALNSSFWTLDSFSFYLYWGNGTLIGSNTSTANGGTLYLFNVNTTNQSYIYMNYSYVINGNYTNFTRNWVIQSTTGRAYSIWRGFTDLTAYIDSSNGLFGIDDFGKLVIALAIIILTVGLVSMRYGIANEAGIMVILFSMVLFFDYGLGWIPQINIGTIHSPQYFVSTITFLLVLVFAIREERF